MVCEYLKDLESALLDAGVAVTYRGQPWTRNCREWVYFDAVLDVDAIQRELALGPPVTVHENTDPKSGVEAGFYCSLCHDAIMGNPRSPRIFP